MHDVPSRYYRDSLLHLCGTIFGTSEHFTMTDNDAVKAQHRITSTSKLLNEQGELIQRGYATSLLLDYCRADIKSGIMRIKEWDYYLIYNKHFGIALTIADNDYMGMLSATVIDFDKPSVYTNSKMTFFPRGSMKLPSSSSVGDVEYSDGTVQLSYKHCDNGSRSISFKFLKFSDKKDLDVEIVLDHEPRDSMVIATPFPDAPQAFYYNQKIVGMRASGTVTYDGTVHTLTDTRGILDWGRGVWTYSNTWYWSALTGVLSDGTEFGFNLGYGFGDTSAATENMLFVNGVAHKLTDVVFNIPCDDKGNHKYTDTWTLTSSDSRVDMTFKPIIDRAAYTTALVICSDQHQVFGTFSGTVTLDDGSILNICDMVGFAERVYNRW